jgi:hypothetical protein
MRNAARLRLWSNLPREIAKDAASLLLNRYIFRQMQEVVRRNQQECQRARSLTVAR